MEPVGGLFCSDGNINSVKDQSEYVVGFDESEKDQVKNDCKAYIEYAFGIEEFEKARGISINRLLESAELNVSYERYIPINENSIDYDIWGSGTYRIGYGPGKGAKKVWVLTFTDDPWGDDEK